jgi:hypothetical protein
LPEKSYEICLAEIFASSKKKLLTFKFY